MKHTETLCLESRQGTRSHTPPGSRVPRTRGRFVMLLSGGLLPALVWMAPFARGRADQAAQRAEHILSLAEARLLALENNAVFQVERLQPAVQRTREEEERAVFDPVVSAHGAGERLTDPETAGTRYRGTLEIEQLLPAGTRLALGSTATRGERPPPGDGEVYAGQVRAVAAQPLLRGRGSAVQQARLRQARIDTEISREALRALAEVLVARVEQALWDLALAERRIVIYEESQRLAEDQQAEVEERIRFGRLPEMEWAAVAAEVAQRREDLINARALLARRRIEVLRLVGPAAFPWDTPLLLADEPAPLADEPDPVEHHVRHALLNRPELREARWRVERGDVELVRTRNGLLPYLEVFVALGRTGYADSFSRAYTSPDMEEDRFEAGLQAVYTLGRRRERGVHERGRLHRLQAEEALRNMEEAVEAEVRGAHIEALRTRDQMAATEATRRFREEALRAETEKLRVGRSTSLLVAQAQRDVVAARITEVEAVVEHLKARLQLERFDASLLASRGITLAE